MESALAFLDQVVLLSLVCSARLITALAIRLRKPFLAR